MSDGMNNHENQENQVEETRTEGETAYSAQDFISDELAAAKKALSGTQVWGSVFVLAVACVLGGIGNGFASNLAPKEAAKITKGLVIQRLDDLQMQASTYLKEQIPQFIEQAPEWAMAQLPEQRTNIENKLEEQFTSFAHETSGKLDNTFDTFIDENADQFKTIILAGQDKETTDAVAADLRDKFMAYLTTPGEDGESVQDKFDKSLEMLEEIEQKTHHLAFDKNLDATDAKTRRAVAVLFGTISENKDLMPIPNKEDVQDAISAHLPESAENPAEGEAPVGDDTPAASAPAKSAAPALKQGMQPANPKGKATAKITTPVVIGGSQLKAYETKSGNAALDRSRSFGPHNGAAAKPEHNRAPQRSNDDD